MLDAREGSGRSADRTDRHAEEQPDRHCGERVRHVVRAGDPELIDRHHAAVGRVATRQRQHATGHDPAIVDAEPARRRRTAPVRDRARRAEIRVRRHHRILGVQDERTRRVHALGEDPLRPSVGLQGAVPVEVVRGDVRVDGDGRAARQRRELELRKLVDDPMLRRQLGEPVEDRHADVPAQHDGMARIGGQDRRRERRGGRLALGARHPDRRRDAQSQEQVGLGDEGRRRGIARGPGRDQLAKRRP